MHATEHIFLDRTIWQQHATTVIADAIRDAVTKRGRCTLGLSGGSTPVPVYRSLAREAIDWTGVTVFLADERCVPPTDPQSNQLLVRTTLLDHLSVQPTALFPDTSLPPAACADSYDAQLRTLLLERGADVLVLGMGQDGHTASLFPPVRDAAPDRFVIHTQTDQFAVRDRISMTPLVLQTTEVPIVLLQGEEKLTVWQAMKHAPYDPSRWPLQTAVAGGNAILLACR